MKDIFSAIVKLIFIVLINSTLQKNITVHVVPHTHDDAGWVETFEQYYTENVTSILNHLVKSLNENPNRTFIYVEQVYFTKWWNATNDTNKESIRRFVKEGRLEFILGGYVMQDEADTYYQDIIDQMRLGMDFLYHHFNVTPNIGWFIDPFGHSTSNMYLLRKMGFNITVIDRIDYKDKNIRRKDQTMEFHWKPYFDLEYGKTNVSEIFTHVQYDSYCLPARFSFMLNGSEFHFNPPEMKAFVDDFMNDIIMRQASYNHSHYLFTYGCDFAYQHNSNNFKNIEQVMNYLQETGDYSNIKLTYSTPSKYFDAINKEQKYWTELKNYDFFPYSDYPFSYWTGYFTSRPYLKGMVRDTGHFLKSTSTLLTELMLELGEGQDKLVNETLKSIHYLRRNLAILQHHDAITGTAKDFVAADYINRMNESILIVRNSLNELLGKFQNINSTELVNCINQVSNSQCADIVFPLNSKKSVMIIFSNNRQGEVPLSFKAVDSNIELFDEDGTEIPREVICDDAVVGECSVYFTRIFEKYDTFRFILVKKVQSPALTSTPISSTDQFTFSFINDTTKYTVIGNEGRILVEIPSLNQSYNFALSHRYYYATSQETVRPLDTNPPGAYVFAPDQLLPFNFTINQNSSLFWDSDIVKQIQIQTQNTTLYLRFFKCFKNVIEVESKLNAFNMSLEQSIGFALHVESDIQNLLEIKSITPEQAGLITVNNDSIKIMQPQFYTDSNAMKMLRRVKDYRIDWDFYLTEIIADNFYPVGYAISAQDNQDIVEDFSVGNRVLTVLTERAQAGGAMEKGQIIMMLNRYSTTDDWKGLGENLQESLSMNYSFFVKNWVVVSRDFDYRSIRDHVVSRPTIFQWNLNVSNHRSIVLNSHSLINELVDYDYSCIELNYYIENENEVLVQAYNFLQPFFNVVRNCEVQFNLKSFEFLTVERINLGGRTIEFEKKHDNANYYRPGKKFYSSSNTTFTLIPQDIQLFKVNFKR